MATLAEIRAKLQASSQQNGGSATGGDNAIYPHWNIQEGSNATVRFLPDADPNNTFFWIERAMIKLPFAGVKGETNSKPVTVQVPCMEMWNETCPILTEVRPWFKDKSLEDMGRKYWKKKSYLFQGFVVESKLQEDKTPENPIRRFIIGSQIFNIIKAALLDPDMEELPTDYVRGTDFRITKTSKGGYADYSTSNWARRERALDEAELAAIKAHGVFNLKDFLPKKPGEVELKVMKEMFEASVDGEAFDMERWGQYFKPAGYNNKGTDAVASAKPKASAPATIEEDDVPFEEAAPAAAPVKEEASADSASGRAQDILAMIRNRNKQ
jgi:gp32 DNA binding protein like